MSLNVLEACFEQIRGRGLRVVLPETGPDEVTALVRLLADFDGSDVVLESFRPGVIGRLGLTGPGEYELFTVMLDFAQVKDESLCSHVFTLRSSRSEPVLTATGPEGGRESSRHTPCAG